MRRATFRERQGFIFERIYSVPVIIAGILQLGASGRGICEGVRRLMEQANALYGAVKYKTSGLSGC